MDKSEVGIKRTTLKSLFLNKKFYIPKYQRDYAWEKKNIETFINDIYNNTNYYIGNISISEKDDLELIDGQQRIISAYLCFAVLNRLFAEKKINGFEKQILFIENKPRIILDDRTADQYTKIMSYLINCQDVPENVSKCNEYKQYKNIYSILKTYPIDELKLFYSNLKNCQLVTISCKNTSITSYQLFLNLNTKGVKLTNCDIVKSLLFSELEKDENEFDSYRNSWHEMTMSIFNLDDYFATYLMVFHSTNKTRITKNNIIDEFKKEIKDHNSAKKIFDNLTSINSVYYCTYLAIVEGKTKYYINLFNESSVKLENLFDLNSYIKSINFHQFDIAFISMLCFNDKDKKYVRNNFAYICSFVKFVFLYSLLNGLRNISPSTYANKFISFAVKLRDDKKNMKNHIMEILKTFSIQHLKYENGNEVVDSLMFLDKLKVEHNGKYLKYITSMISILDGSSRNQFTGEHILSLISKYDESSKMSFANIVPVIYDDYGNVTLEEKIPKYYVRKNIEPHLKIFLENDYKGNTEFISNRSIRYKKLFVEEYNALYDDLIK